MHTTAEVPATWNFPDTRPDVAAFADLMTGALEAVMVRQHLYRLQATDWQGRWDQ